MHHVPGRAIAADVEMLLKLASAHAFLRVHHNRDRHEPCTQRDVGAVEDRANGRGEAMLAGSLQTGKRERALVLGQSLADDLLDFVVTADGAAHPIWPA